MRKSLAFLLPAAEAPNSFPGALGDEGEALVRNIAGWLDSKTLVTFQRIGDRLVVTADVPKRRNRNAGPLERGHAGEAVELPLARFLSDTYYRDATLTMPQLELREAIVRAEQHQVSPSHAAAPVADPLDETLADWILGQVEISAEIADRMAKRLRTQRKVQ